MKDIKEKRTDNKKLAFLLWEMIFSIAIFTLGIFSCYKSNTFLKSNVIDITPEALFVEFISLFLVGTALTLLVDFFLRKKKNLKRNFYKIVFIFGNLYGALTITPAILSLIVPPLWAYVITIILTIYLFYQWHKKPTIWNHNLLMILGLAGTGGMLGLELGRPSLIAILLAVLAVYDFIAVYKTKHMVKMAETMIESQTIVGLFVPSRRKELLEPTPTNATRKKFVVLGGGDLAIPLMLATSFIPLGLSKSIIVAIFAFLGMALSFWLFYSQKEKQAIPASPAIAFISLIGCVLAIVF